MSEPTWTPTVYLRQVVSSNVFMDVRVGRTITLQQKYIESFTGAEEWRDVELIEETPE